MVLRYALNQSECFYDLILANQRLRLKHQTRNIGYLYEFAHAASMCFAVKMFCYNNCMYMVVHLNKTLVVV